MRSASRFGTPVIVIGVLVAVCGALLQFGLLPGAQVSLPPPVAQRRPTPETTATPAAALQAATIPLATAAVDHAGAPVPVATAAVEHAATPTVVVGDAAEQGIAALLAADADDRREARTPPQGGYAVRLAIPDIDLETPVQQAGIVYDERGNPTWQTLPFVAVHYGDLTALVGGPGNAVIAGHVVTQHAGNVFRSLYRVDIATNIQVWDEHDQEHDFQVEDVHLVSPEDTSPFQQTPEPTLTLITCGGSFDYATREFSERLIVTARPVER